MKLFLRNFRRIAIIQPDGDWRCDLKNEIPKNAKASRYGAVEV